MKKLNFYSQCTETRKVQINHSNLLDFLANAGYGRVEQGNNYELVHQKNKQLRSVDSSELSRYVLSQLKSDHLTDVRETYVRGVGQFLTSKKLDLLPKLKVVSDMDDAETSRFYFRNCYVKISNNDMQVFDYTSLEHSIWTNRLIPRNFKKSSAVKNGQFERFCKNISGDDSTRFKHLQSVIGYLLHRYKNPSITKAIIFYDENMHKSTGAEGGTGKTLISNAIAKCREVVTYNGKELKNGSWFKNQRITPNTDLVVYDDVPEKFDFESLFPILTTGIEVERKREHSFEIPFKESPKVFISSNYYVGGPGGSSDRRRRCEFEVANFYSDKFTPYDDFGATFFEEWSFEEWNSFFVFMMNCVQIYLKEGLLHGDIKENSKRRVEGTTSIYFYEYISSLVELGEKNDQREFVEVLQKYHPDLTSHQFTKWLKIYCSEMNLNLIQKSSGSDYFFFLLKNS